MNDKSKDEQINLNVIIMVAIVIIGGLLVLGIAKLSQPSHNTTDNASTGPGLMTNGPSGSGSPGQGSGMVIGTVVSADAKSVTLKLEDTGENRTFSASAGTVEMPGRGMSPKEYDAADVKIGSRAAAQPEGDTLRAILLNYSE